MNLTEEIRNKMYQIYVEETKKINNNELGIKRITLTQSGFFKMTQNKDKYYEKALIILREKKLRRICSKLETM